MAPVLMDIINALLLRDILHQYIVYTNVKLPTSISNNVQIEILFYFFYIKKKNLFLKNIQNFQKL